MKNKLSTLAALLLLAAPALAQRKPDPPTPPPAGPREAEVTTEFLQAYKAAGSPRLVIFTYVVSIDETRAAELNDTGLTHQFNARLANMFMHPEVAIRELNLGDLKGKESFDAEFKYRVRTDQLAGARWLAAQSDADVVIFTLLTETNNRTDGTAFAASYTLFDAQRGERFGQWSWDMKPDQGGEFSAPRLGTYATALAKRMYRDFELHFAADWTGKAARTFTLDVSGVPDDQLVSVREIAKSIDGVQEALRPRYETSGRNRRLLLDLRYTGDPFDLSMELRRRAADALGMDVFVGQAREGRIVMRAYAQRPVTPETLLSGDEPPADRRDEADKLRERFRVAYTDKGSPSVAVMINHEKIRPDEHVDPTVSPAPAATPAPAGDAPSVVVSPQVFVDSVVVQDSGNTSITGTPDGRRRPVNTYTDEELLNTRIMENAMLERLGRLDVRRKDLQQAWRLLAEEQKLTERPWDERELARMLGQKAGADIVISGAGRVLQRNAADGYIEVLYSFRAYNVADAEIVASGTVHTLIDADALDLRTATDDMAAQAVGKLAYQMLNTWE